MIAALTATTCEDIVSVLFEVSTLYDWQEKGGSQGHVRAGYKYELHHNALFKLRSYKLYVLPRSFKTTGLGQYASVYTCLARRACQQLMEAAADWPGRQPAQGSPIHVLYI